MIKWKIITTSLFYYIEKKYHVLPDDKEMRECIEFVMKNIVKFITAR